MSILLQSWVILGLISWLQYSRSSGFLKMVFSHKKYKVSPEVASVKLLICLWWLVIALLPCSLWSAAAIWGMTLLSPKLLELFLTSSSFITGQCCFLVTDFSFNLCSILPCDSQNVLGGCSPVVSVCVLLPGLVYRELNWLAQSCQLCGFWLTFEIWPSLAFKLFYVPEYTWSHYRRWL